MTDVPSRPIIEKIRIRNYKRFQDVTINFNEGITIIVGGNESGKTTIVEALSICLKMQINNRSVASEITSHMFNALCVKRYFDNLRLGNVVNPPSIDLEVFFKDGTVDSRYKGTNNSLKTDVAGIKVSIELDRERYYEEFSQYVSNPEGIDTIPTEYYMVRRTSFADKSIGYNELPVKPFIIANMENRFQNGVDRFITDILDDAIDAQNRAKMSVTYRQLRKSFVEDAQIKIVNDSIRSKHISEKNVKISIDTSTKTNLDSTLTLYIDDIPLKYSGKGEQTAIKAKLALKSNIEKTNLIMIEEPEANQSFSNMRQLISSMVEECNEKQTIITTHSSFVINKYGLDKLVLLHDASVRDTPMMFSNLDQGTFEYFKKLPGFDTLRIILSKKVILVEGPSDELIVQKAYSLKYGGRLPLDDGIDVMSINSLAFPRFLDILKLTGNEVEVITDNDGNVESGRLKKLLNYKSETINIHYPDNSDMKTLEPCFVECNELYVLNKVLSTDFDDESSLISYMEHHKTEWAMAVFDTSEKIIIPRYIEDAI